MTFTLPQIIMIMLLLLKVVFESLLHGHQSTMVYKWYNAVLQTIGTVALLWWGGFWK